ncbi:2TM domain-containing protein [Pseudanabaena biceps]|nr:2TM domain-containing protein [Pseudanabaena biceps]
MPKLSKPPDPNDPEYQNLERRVNFYLHLAIYSACSTCMWFIQSITEKVWIWSVWVAIVWGILIVSHVIWVFAKEKQVQNI